MEVNIFEIKLNDRSERLLPAIHKWATIFYTCTLVTCIIDITEGYMSIVLYNRYANLTKDIQKIQTYVDISFIFIYAILVPIQAYYLYLFSKGASQSVRNCSSDEFNASFEWLLKHAKVAAILFLLNSIWAIAQTYFAYKVLVP